uniref:Uncharacterized protein n=1 Tax=Anguilla anguilla TaxID=7936 RepID=A0A0E9WX81_ANGAN
MFVNGREKKVWVLYALEFGFVIINTRLEVASGMFIGVAGFRFFKVSSFWYLLSLRSYSYYVALQKEFIK